MASGSVFRLTLLSVLLLPVGSASAGESDCLEKFKARDYVQAAIECQKIQTSSDSAGVHEALGHMYLHGNGVEKNCQNSVAMYQRAAQEGSPVAAYILGQIYYDGICGGRDPRLSNFYNHLAADQGYQPAVISEVLRHYQQNPVDDSPAAQRDFLLLLENSRSFGADYLLGECYRTGYGTEKNLKKASKHYKKSGEPASYIKLGLIAEEQGYRNEAESRYRTAIEKCVNCSGEAYFRLGLLLDDPALLEKSLVLGYHRAEIELGRRVISAGSSNTEGNWLRGEKYLLDACRRGYTEGCVMAAEIYFRHLPPDPAKNADYLVLLAGTDDGRSYEFLAGEYLRGGHLARDPDLALGMFNLARSRGTLRQYHVLADLYLEKGDRDRFRSICSEGVEKNGSPECRALLAYDDLSHGNSEALSELKKAFEEGSSEAGFLLYSIYSRGFSVPRDVAAAEKYLKQAADAGNLQALGRLFSIYLAAGQLEKAKKCAEMTLERQPSAGYLQLGNIYMQMEPRNYSQAFRYFTSAVSAGEPRALQPLGRMYENGFGTEKDLFRACELYRTAVSREMKNASTDLARCLWEIHDGDGRSLIRYVEKAAQDGDIASIQKLIEIYSDDQSGTRNDRELVRWITVGARLGIQDCLFRLGELYMLGLRELIDRDEALGRKYLTLAMEKGSSPAAWTLSSYYERIGKYREACDIFEKFSDSSDYPFQFNLALCHVNGRGRPKDAVKGEQILLNSYSRNQSSEVSFLLGQIYSDEDLPLYDIEKAMEWYLDAADLGDTGALFNLGALYERNSPEYSPEKAFHYYLKSMETGNMGAQLKVAAAYISGQGTSKDPAKGCDLAEEAVNYSITDANAILAGCYLSGNGREKNLDRALALLHDGSDNNNTECSLMIADIYARGDLVTTDMTFACSYYYKAVLSAQTLDEINQGASRFLPGNVCYNQDHRTYVVLSMLSKKLNTSRYSGEILKIRNSMKERERRSADELLRKFTENDDD